MISSAQSPRLPVPTDRPTQSDATQLPPLILEICSGQTQFPLRPVNSTRFLIGAGEGCDLRLGGDDMPPLHSIVHVDHVETLMESVTLSPALQVNGVALESALLQDGDRIDIGPFQLIAHRPDTTAMPSIAAPPENGLILLHDTDEERTDIADLSASELIELIEAEEQEFQTSEHRRELGANALLDAIVERIPPATIPIDSPADDTGVSGDDLQEELAPLLLRANSLADELERRTAHLSEREAAHMQLTETVFESQQELAKRLESLVLRIIELEDERQPRFPKIA